MKSTHRQFLLQTITAVALLGAAQAQSSHGAHGICGCPSLEDQLAGVGPGSSFFLSNCSPYCSAYGTSINGVYDPGSLPLVEIDVFFHLLEPQVSNAGIPPMVTFEQIRKQIDVLNDAFSGALAPIDPALPTVDTGIRFRLARELPYASGTQQTCGVKRWPDINGYNGIGQYYLPKTILPQKILNVFVMNAPAGDPSVGGSVPYIPQLGSTTIAEDRIELNYRQFVDGTSPNYGKGYGLVHEVGHYLGLLHPFSATCPPINQDYTTGDLIADTEATTEWFYNLCSYPNAPMGCQWNSGPAPIHNFMSYSTHECVYRFTYEQAHRMRCTLDSCRGPLAHPYDSAPRGQEYCIGSSNSTGLQAVMNASWNPYLNNNDLQIFAGPLSLGSSLAFPIVAPGMPYNPTGSFGPLCVGSGQAIIRMQSFIQNVGAGVHYTAQMGTTNYPDPNGGTPISIQYGQTWGFQLWYRDFDYSTGTAIPVSRYSNAYKILFVP